MAQIVVVDDNASMREAIALIFETEADLSICGEASCIADALQQCVTLRPDLALIDLSLRGEDGLVLVSLLAESSPALRTVVFSLHDEAFYIDGARNAGARGYVVKSDAPQQMIDCVRRVLNGQTQFPQPRSR